MANGTTVQVGSGTGVVSGGNGDDILLAGPQVFTATFQPVNGSGVAGNVRVSIDGDQMRLQADLTGLEAGQAHPLHIHGLTGSGDAPLDNAALSTSLDTDRDGFIELLEARPAGGPVLLDLGSQTAGTDGAVHVDRLLDLHSLSGLSQGSTAADLFPLDFRVVEIHGLSVDASDGIGTSGEVDGTAGYKATLPVASAALQAEGGTTTTTATDAPGAMVLGGNGSDRLVGGTGDDILVGGRGADVLAGGGGNDDLVGGRGADRYVVGQGKDVITNFDAAGGDRLVFSQDSQSGSLVLHDTTQGTWVIDGDGAVEDPTTHGVLLLGIHAGSVSEAAGWFA